MLPASACLLMPLTARSASAVEVAPQVWLLQQIRIGEATNKYDLVTQSLYRLEKIDPDNPELVAAQLRLALHQGEQEKAQRLMARLKRIAPGAAATRQAAAALLLASPEGRQQLQQARLLATSGRLAAARSAYDKQFNGIFPDVDIALEYWRLVARIDGQQSLALARLQALEQQYPGHPGVRLQIAALQLQRNNDSQAFSQLKAVAQNPAGREQAASLWLTRIVAQPVSATSVAQLQTYLDTFTSGEARRKGQQELERQQKLLADPLFRQRMSGLAQVSNGAGAAAIPALRAALTATPNDAELLGAMGQALSRANQRAAATGYFTRAIQAGQQSTSIGKWRSLLRSDSYWLAIDNGDKALARADVSAAQRYYQQAQALDRSEVYALLGLGDVALARKNNAAAEQFFLRALRLDPTNSNAARRLSHLYQQQSAQKAVDFIQRLSSPAQQRALGSLLNSLRSEVRRAEGDALAQQGRWQAAADKYYQAQHAAPDDVWLNYRLAGALRQAGLPQQADRLMAAMAQQRPADRAQVYAYGLYLSSGDRRDQALARLNTLPESQWDRGMRELASRLQQEKILARANRLRDGGNETAAVALLQQQPLPAVWESTLADWALARGDARQALQRYQRLLARSPQDDDAALGRIEALVALQRPDEARSALQALPPQTVKQSINRGRRVASAWQALGDTDRARDLYKRLKNQAAQQIPSPASALVYRDAARLEARQQPQLALADYRQAMVASGISHELPQDNLNFTRLMRSDEQDDWLKRGLRSDAADLWRQQETTLTLQQDYSRNKGTGGISNLSIWTTMLEAETPVADGKGFLRLDRVAMSAGSFNSDNGGHRKVFGTCADNNTNGCSRDLQQRAAGVSPAIGWRNQRWSADVGTTPLGFLLHNWVGGVSWNHDIRDLGLSLTASRRPISSSLLAFAGAQDPSSEGGRSWGGVVATGGSIGLSYDRGGADGLWGDLSAHQLSGNHVADNTRERLMGGYYYKLVNSDRQRMTVGVSSMLWHYQKDLSDYSFGQGGYYSPQRYFSLALPLSWRQRTEHWSCDFSASPSWSYSRSSGEARYPVDPGFATRDHPFSDNSSGGGLGYTLQAVIERRLTAHWTLGAAIDIQQAKDYTPSHGLMYLRYSMAGWEGDLDWPAQPLTPYAEFK
ncbi:cellulose synthase complex outer membrane protein BcsC [Pantoea sp. B65]|uniref:cellulose synthase complex outer membrane protein BcsC n=1 Tax=Pantoea sp. B65 TaxID=2813359 RepID=UPI0039B535C2